MKVVLTNDDGIEAPGLAALITIISEIAAPVVVAPRIEQSGAAHRVTARLPISFREAGENRYWVDATPADCARVALKHLAPDADWLVSGINPGANLGSDVYNSGTVAAAREAAILGCRSIAISQYISRGHPIDWARPPYATPDPSCACCSQVPSAPAPSGMSTCPIPSAAARRWHTGSATSTPIPTPTRIWRKARS